MIVAGSTTLCSRLSAQQSDSAQVAIYFKFSQVLDTAQRDKPHTENMVLLIGRTSGVYKSSERPMQQQVSTNPDGTTQINTQMRGTQDEYYQLPNEKRLVRKELIGMYDAFIITNDLPAIDWHITSDTATFGGLHCQKATTHFKGRDYIAWFCADLPLHVGPWKLNGLPGVIVDAYDATNDVRFTFDGVSKPDPVAIQSPGNGVKTTEKEFAKMKSMASKNPAAFSRLMAQYGNGPTGPRPPGGFASGPVINNPLELPEKK